jgi:hypothetical protein
VCAAHAAKERERSGTIKACFVKFRLRLDRIRVSAARRHGSFRAVSPEQRFAHPRRAVSSRARHRPATIDPYRS